MAGRHAHCGQILTEAKAEDENVALRLEVDALEVAEAHLAEAGRNTWVGRGPVQQQQQHILRDMLLARHAT